MNLWREFQRIQRPVVRIGEVVEIFGGRSKILDYAGKTFWANGASVPVGQIAYTENGLVVRAMADLEGAEPVVVYV
jgi:hypothetical protein